MFQDKVVVITGGAGGIGKCIAEEFEKAGAKVCVIDIAENPYFVGDIGDEATLRSFAEKVINEYGKVDYLINNAPPLFKGIDKCTYEEFNYALRVGVSAAFLLTKLFMSHFASGACVINISSSRDRMSQPQSESYAAAKGGISALTHALAVSLGGKVRVNSISPGWIDTNFTVLDEETERTVLGRLRSLKDRTAIAVTHRPAAIALCDWHLEIADGKIRSQRVAAGDLET